MSDMTRIGSERELLAKLDVISRPDNYNLTQRMADQALIDFCAACPDPVGARWLIVECMDSMSDEELVMRALKMPKKAMASIPVAVVPADHPSRSVRE